MKTPFQFFTDLKMATLAEVFADGSYVKFAADKNPVLFIQSVLLCLQTFGSLPGTHARSSVIKTLRGNSAQTKNPYHGVLAGNRVINNDALTVIAEQIIKFLEECDATEDEDLIATDEQESAPDWVSAANKAKNKKHIQDIADKLIAAMAAEGIAPLTKAADRKSVV